MITWDDKKRLQVIKDHGIDFKGIDDVFNDPFASYIADFEHDESEERWLIIAKSSEYGLVAVIIAFRDDDVRFVTARRAERWMVRRYERQRKRS